MGKGKKRAHEPDASGDVIDLLDESDIAEPSNKKAKQVNGVADKIDIWLVKKPKNVSIEALDSIRIPKKFKDSTRERSFETSGGIVDCTFERPSRSMVYFQAPDVLQSIKEGAKLPILHVVRGIAMIKEQPNIDDPFPDALEEEV